MFSEVIKACERFVESIPSPDKVESVSSLMSEINPLLAKLQVTNDNMPFGRYLLYMDKNQMFNIQIHVFSKNYTGSIHCHQTWGMMTVIKGSLYVTDWIQDGDNWDCIRASLVARGSSTCFTPPAPDWHRTDTSKSNSQAVSIHIYGGGWDMDQGIYLDDSFVTQIGDRGPIQDNSQLLPYLTKI